jgi:hypothetical protein
VHPGLEVEVRVGDPRRLEQGAAQVAEERGRVHRLEREPVEVGPQELVEPLAPHGLLDQPQEQ